MWLWLWAGGWFEFGGFVNFTRFGTPTSSSGLAGDVSLADATFAIRNAKFTGFALGISLRVGQKTTLEITDTTFDKNGLSLSNSGGGAINGGTHRISRCTFLRCPSGFSSNYCFRDQAGTGSPWRSNSAIEDSLFIATTNYQSYGIYRSAATISSTVQQLHIRWL